MAARKTTAEETPRTAKSASTTKNAREVQQFEVEVVTPQVFDEIQFNTVSGVAVVGTAWTVQLSFSETMIGPNKKAFARQAPVVSMPWQLAKALKLILDSHIRKYEETEGEIRLPSTFDTESLKKP